MAVGNWTTSYYFQDLFNQHPPGIHSKEGLLHVKTLIEKNALIFMFVMENNIFINLLKMSVMGLQNSDSMAKSLAIFCYKLDTVNTS